MSTIHGILAEFREAARNKRDMGDMGDKFELLFSSFLVTDPYYKDRFTQVWLWNEWSGRGNKPDTGIDLVAEERIGGGLCAIQCKFYDPDSIIQKADLDSFFATSARAPFTSRIVVTTTDNWSKNAEPLLDDGARALHPHPPARPGGQRVGLDPVHHRRHAGREARSLACRK